MGSVTSTSFVVTGLSYSIPYYWRVEADDGKVVDPVSSPVWSFTTESSPIIPPEINPIPDDSTLEGASYTGPTPTLSRGTLPVTWSLAGGPAEMTIDPDTGVVVSLPSATFSGSPHTITIQATNTAGSDDESWQMTVVPLGLYNGDFEIIDPSDSSNPDGWTLKVGGRDDPGWGLHKDVLNNCYYSGSHSIYFRLIGYSTQYCYGIIKSPLIDTVEGDLVWYQSQKTDFDASDVEYTIKFYDGDDNLVSSNLYYTDTTTSQAGLGLETMILG